MEILLGFHSGRVLVCLRYWRVFVGFFFFRYSFFLITFVSPLDIYQYMMGVNTNRGKRVTLGEDSQAGDG